MRSEPVQEFYTGMHWKVTSKGDVELVIYSVIVDVKDCIGVSPKDLG